MVIKSNTRIVITDHACQRFRERFRLACPQKYQGDMRMFKSFIVALVQQGIVRNCWKSVPFYVNKLATEHGEGTEIIENKGIFFIAHYFPERNTVRIVTVVKNMLYYGTADSVVVTTAGGARWVHKDVAKRMLTNTKKVVR